MRPPATLLLALAALGCDDAPADAGDDTAAADSQADADTDTDADTDADADTDPPITRSVTTADVVFDGDFIGDRAGRYVAAAGDIDGDGRGDLYLGSDAGDGGQTEPGRVYLVTAASLPDAGPMDLTDAPYLFQGDEVGDMAGHSGGTAGDVDGDGLDDIVISAYHASDDGAEQGQIYLILAGGLTPGARSVGDADHVFGGPIDYGRLGHGLAGVGDVDGDGRDDVLVGECCGDPPTRGAVWLLRGADLDTRGYEEVDDHLPRWDGAMVGDGAGVKCGHAGDVDGDGLDDLLVAARLSMGTVPGGRVYLIPGSTVTPELAGDLATVDQQFVGVATGGELGYSITAAGDLDDDGLPDLLLGAYHAGDIVANGGAVYVFLASQLDGTEVAADAAWLQIVSSEENEQVGVGVAGEMDLDGDTRADFAVGASGLAPPTLEGSEIPPGTDSPGDAYLFLGARLSGGVLDVTDAAVHIEGDALQDHAGVTVAAPGDLDGDGASDLLVGSERGQLGLGRAWLFYGLMEE